MASAFSQAWDVVKAADEVDLFLDTLMKAARSRGVPLQERADYVQQMLESGDEGAVPVYLSGLAGNKSKRHYQKFLREAAERLGSRRLIEPFAGALGASLSVRPPEVFIGNDYNPAVINLHRNVRDNPELLEWNPVEEYTMGVGDDRTLGGSSMMPVQPEEEAFFRATVPKWAEQVPEGRVLQGPFRYLQMREELNNILSQPEWYKNRDMSVRAARLIGIMQPMMQGGRFRMNAAMTGLNMPPRGPSNPSKRTMFAENPEMEAVFAEMMPSLRQVSPRVTTPNFLINPPEGIQSIDPSRPVTYTPWSEIMRQADWNFHIGEASPFLDTMADAKQFTPSTLTLLDPPYLGEVGEHAHWAKDDYAKQRALMAQLQVLAAEGLPIIHFNSDKPLVRELNEAAGMRHLQFLDRPNVVGGNQLVENRKEAPESIGVANIPFITEQLIQDLDTRPESERAVRSRGRATGHSWYPEQPGFVVD